MTDGQKALFMSLPADGSCYDPSAWMDDRGLGNGIIAYQWHKFAKRCIHGNARPESLGET